MTSDFHRHSGATGIIGARGEAVARRAIDALPKEGLTADRVELDATEPAIV